MEKLFIWKCFAVTGIFPYAFHKRNCGMVCSPDYLYMCYFNTLLVSLSFAALTADFILGYESVDKISNWVYNASALEFDKQVNFCWYDILFLSVVSQSFVSVLLRYIFMENHFGMLVHIYIHLIPFAHLLFFSLMIHHVEMCFVKLNKKLGEIVKQGDASKLNLRRIRIRYIKVTSTFKRLVDENGISNLFVISGTVIHILETFHCLVTQYTRGTGLKLYEVAYLLLPTVEAIINITNLTFRNSSIEDQSDNMVRNVLKINAEGVDFPALSEMVQMIDEMRFLKVNVTASGCFSMNVTLLFSICGVVTSYIMVITPFEMMKSNG